MLSHGLLGEPQIQDAVKAAMPSLERMLVNVTSAISNFIADHPKDAALLAAIVVAGIFVVKSIDRK